MLPKSICQITKKNTPGSSCNILQSVIMACDQAGTGISVGSKVQQKYCRYPEEQHADNNRNEIFRGFRIFVTSLFITIQHNTRQKYQR